MPFTSEKQKRFMFARHPEIAKKFVAHAKETHQPLVRPRVSKAVKKRG